MILNSLLDSLHHIVFINIGETKMLFLGVSEGVIHNKTDVQGEPTHPSMKAVQIIKKKKKKQEAPINFSRVTQASNCSASHAVLEAPSTSRPPRPKFTRGRGTRWRGW